MSARRSAMSVALVVGLAGCGSAFEPGERPREQEGGYNLSVAPFEGTWTTWDPDIGVVVLGPEETGDQLAQLIIHLGREIVDTTLLNPYVPVPTNSIRKFSFVEGVRTTSHFSWFPVDSATTLSTTDHREGTGAEINGKLYELGKPVDQDWDGCRNLVKVGAIFDDYIEAEFCFVMDRVIVHPDDDHEQIELSGMFLAVNP